MAPHSKGNGASVTGVSHSDPQGAATKERYVLGLLNLLEQEENNLSRVVNRTDKITITVNMSTKMADVDILLNVIASVKSEGEISYNATPYLTGSTFTSGTGGESTATNLPQALQQSIITLRLIELDTARNLNNPVLTVIKRCQHTIANSGGTNATFTALLQFPIEVINLPGGGSVIEAKTYLN
jgi:hypothetical protein